MYKNCSKDKEETIQSRPVLGRRVTCQYYSPALVLSSNDGESCDIVSCFSQSLTNELYFTLPLQLTSIFLRFLKCVDGQHKELFYHRFFSLKLNIFSFLNEVF